MALRKLPLAASEIYARDHGLLQVWIPAAYGKNLGNDRNTEGYDMSRAKVRLHNRWYHRRAS